MRGESGPLKPGPGSGGDPRLGGPSQGRAAVTHPRPIAHTPPAASLAALAAKPRRRGPGGWGGTGGRRAAAPEGSGQRRGMGRAPGASRRPCPLQEPFRSVTWDPDPRERRLDKRVWWPQRERPAGSWGRGERRPVPPSRPWPPGPPRRGRCGWREPPPKPSGSRWGGGGEPCGGGRGRADVTLLCFHWSLVVGAGGRENVFLWGLGTFKAWHKGPEIKSSKTPSVCGRHKSHGQRPTAMVETSR